MSARALLGIVSATTIGCSFPSPDAHFTQQSLPDSLSFPYVGELLEHRCGTLDCHGSVYRNLRVYGDEGLRYSSADRPCIPEATTPAEFGQDYGSVVGLQPEIMGEVIADRGAEPERLDLLAKPMGLESHKGLTLIQKGDDPYTCITSWLAGRTDTTACLHAMPSTVCSIPTQSLLDSGSE